MGVMATHATMPTDRPVDEGTMTKRKKPTPRRRVARAPQYVMRVNVLLTQDQYLKLQAWARDEGRPLPNLIRRLLDLGIADRKTS